MAADTNPTRLDRLLVARHIVASRTVAARHIVAGEVAVNGSIMTKPASKVAGDAVIELRSTGPQYASRAGHKLAGALEVFQDIDVAGTRCLDAGASTGGFTDVLLRGGAAQVLAVDVGHDQLVQRLRDDPRVHVHEGLNIRYMTLEDIGQPVDVVVGDLSFISLRLVMSALVGVAAQGANFVLMIKPQFEIGRERLPKTGVVVAADQRREATLGVLHSAVEHGLTPQAVAASSLPGQDGNKEFFFWATLEPASIVYDDGAVEQWLDTQHVVWADEE